MWKRRAGKDLKNWKPESDVMEKKRLKNFRFREALQNSGPWKVTTASRLRPELLQHLLRSPCPRSMS